MLPPDLTAKRTVLVVDDAPENLTAVSALLKDSYRVKVATSGARALRIVSEAPPHLILLDVMMPEMDGHEVCRRLKADPATAGIPVIFLTAKSEVADEKLGFDLGAVDYITKPISPPIVMARVRTHLLLQGAREYLEEKNLFLETTFARYVSPGVLEKLKATPLKDFLQMERREMTILFTDLRGFTALGNALSPEEIQETVNSALETMVGILGRHEGTVDKFLGDGLMALFGAPLKTEDHALRALRAAREMARAHGRWLEGRRARRLPARPLGIGLATGEVVVGNLGTPTRMEYTALGHTVNLAARLCGVADGGEVLTTPRTRDAALGCVPPGDAVPYVFSAKGNLSLKNIDEPVEVLAVEDRDPR